MIKEVVFKICLLQDNSILISIKLLKSEITERGNRQECRKLMGNIRHCVEGAVKEAIEKKNNVQRRMDVRLWNNNIVKQQLYYMCISYLHPKLQSDPLFYIPQF